MTNVTEIKARELPPWLLNHHMDAYVRSISKTQAPLANADAIHCESHDGVLVIHIPKKDTTEAKPKHIKID